jgi:nucleoside-diphosphate-sugar epimerase
VDSADAVIEALAGPDMKTISAKLLNAVGDISAKRPTGSAKITYIYTSGTWIHGDDRKTVVTDTTPIGTPVQLIAWRAAFELEVVNHSHLNSVVIRPSMLYGRSGSIFAMMFQRAHEGKLTWPGKPGGRLPIIHQDDLADFYVRATERGTLIKGTIFDASENTTQSTDELLAKMAEVAGLKGSYEYVEPTNCECLIPSAQSMFYDGTWYNSIRRGDFGLVYRPPLSRSNLAWLGTTKAWSFGGLGIILHSMEGERRFVVKGCFSRRFTYE